MTLAFKVKRVKGVWGSFVTTWIKTSTSTEGKDALLIIEGDAQKMNSKKRYGIEVLNVEIIGDRKDRISLKLIWELD